MAVTSARERASGKGGRFPSSPAIIGAPSVVSYRYRALSSPTRRGIVVELARPARSLRLQPSAFKSCAATRLAAIVPVLNEHGYKRASVSNSTADVALCDSR